MGIEDEFVQRLKAGDANAYEAFVRWFETPLYRYFLASHGDPQLATEHSADCFGDLICLTFHDKLIRRQVTE